MMNTRPTAESKFVVRTYNKCYYFDILEEAIKFARQKASKNTCTGVNLHELVFEGFNISFGKQINY